MVLTNYYVRVTPFTNPDVADKLQFKLLKKSQPFRSTIQPLKRLKEKSFHDQRKNYLP
jgi:hypothetical protein